MRLIITILFASFILNVNSQTAEKIIGNVKSIETLSFDVYSQNGKEIQTPSQYKTKYNYTKQHQLTSIYKSYDNGKFKLSSKYVYNNGKIDSINNYYDGTLSFFWIHIYYTSGLLKMKKKVYGNSVSDINNETYFFYNDNGQLIEERHFIEVNGSREVGRLMAVYDKELGFFYSPDRATKYKITTKNGLIVKVESIDKLFVKTFAYDKYGNVLKFIQVTNYDNEESIRSEAFTYKYDKTGNWIERKGVFVFQGMENQNLVKRTIEYY